MFALTSLQHVHLSTLMVYVVGTFSNPFSGDGIGDRIASAYIDRIGDLIDAAAEWTYDAFLDNIAGWLELILRYLVSTPTPGDDRVVFEDPNSGLFPALMDIGDDMMMIATTMFLLLFAIVLLFNAMFNTAKFSKFYTRGFIVFAILLIPNAAYEIAFILLEISNAVTMVFLPSPEQTTEAFVSQMYDVTAGYNILLASIMVPFMIGMGSLLFIIAQLRIALVYLLTIMMPLLLIMWVFDTEGFLGTIGSIAERGFGLFISVALFPIPVAISLAVGVELLSVDTATYTAEYGSPVMGMTQDMFTGFVMTGLGWGIISVGTVAAILMSKIGRPVAKGAVKVGAGAGVAAATIASGGTAGAAAKAGTATVSGTARKAMMASHYAGGGGESYSDGAASSSNGSSSSSTSPPKERDKPASSMGSDPDSEPDPDPESGQTGGGGTGPFAPDPIDPPTAATPEVSTEMGGRDSVGLTPNGESGSNTSGLDEMSAEGGSGPFENPSPTTPKPDPNEHVRETTQVDWYGSDEGSTPEPMDPPVKNVRSREGEPNPDLPSVTYTSDVSTPPTEDTGMSDEVMDSIRDDVDVSRRRNSWAENTD